MMMTNQELMDDYEELLDMEEEIINRNLGFTVTLAKGLYEENQALRHEIEGLKYADVEFFESGFIEGFMSAVSRYQKGTQSKQVAALAQRIFDAEYKPKEQTNDNNG